MAGRKKNVQIVVPLESSEAFAKAIADSAKYLTVIDLCESWCGACVVMDPIFRKLYADLEKADERLRIHSIDAALLTEQQKHNLPPTGAKPVFLVYKQGVLIAKILGANAPEIELSVMENVPPAEAEA